MDKRLLDILCCPVSRLPVKPLNRQQLEHLNQAIGRGDVVTTAGAKVNAPLKAALIVTDGKSIYRIDDDIPVMLADEAIGTTQLHDFPN